MLKTVHVSAPTQDLRAPGLADPRTEIWTRHGIQGQGTAPPWIAGQYAGKSLMIIGCGRNVWEDLTHYPRYQYGPMQKPYDPMVYHAFDVMAINEIGMYLPHVDHWVSMHDDVLRHLSEIRKQLGLAETMLHSNTPLRPDTHCACCGGMVYWHLAAALGCSGLLAVHIAVLLGYEAILLAGIPADNHGNFYHPATMGGTHGVVRAKERWEAAIRRVPAIAQRVRSLSGWTRELLGAPDGV